MLYLVQRNVFTRINCDLNASTDHAIKTEFPFSHQASVMLQLKYQIKDNIKQFIVKRAIFLNFALKRINKRDLVKPPPRYNFISLSSI